MFAEETSCNVYRKTYDEIVGVPNKIKTLSNRSKRSKTSKTRKMNNMTKMIFKISKMVRTV